MENVGKYNPMHPSDGTRLLTDKIASTYIEAVLMHKCMYNQAPSYLSEMFTKRNQIHDRETRDLTYQSIGLRPVKEHLNTQEPKFGMHYRQGIKIDS